MATIKKAQSGASLKEKVKIARKLYKDNPGKVFNDAVKRAENNLNDSISKAKMIKKATPKAQSGKKVDANTTIQKAKLDNKYNKIYAQTKRDSVAESNKELPYTYAKLRSKTGKSPSAVELRAAQDKQNKEIVKKTSDPKNTTPSPNPKNNKLIDQKNQIKEARRIRLAKTQGKSPLDAKGRADAIFIGMKKGGVIKKKMKSGGRVTKKK